MVVFPVVPMNFSPFPSLHHAVAWCCYHANFVARSFLPTFITQLVCGMLQYFEWTDEQRIKARTNTAQIINSVARYFPFLAPHFYRVRVNDKDKKLGWVSLSKSDFDCLSADHIDRLDRWTPVSLYAFG